MALLNLSRHIVSLHRLPGSISSHRIRDQAFRCTQYNPIWWGSTSAGDNKDSKVKSEDEGKAAANGTGGPEAASTEAASSEAEGAKTSSPSHEEVVTQLSEARATEKKLNEQVESLTDKLKRSLAEMENVRMRSTREIETAKKFGPQGLIKDLLDVPDNLERAAASVPEEVLTPGSTSGSTSAPEPGSVQEAERLRGLLKGLLEGVRATEKILLQVLRKQGAEQYNPLGEKFDPNFHLALFEVPDASKEPGTVAIVTKRGYKLHERVIRPAEVGVARAP